MTPTQELPFRIPLALWLVPLHPCQGGLPPSNLSFRPPLSRFATKPCTLDRHPTIWLVDEKIIGQAV
jgi:hypothetical protein